MYAVSNQFSIPSLIASYASEFDISDSEASDSTASNNVPPEFDRDIQKKVTIAWNKVWREGTSEQFVHWLINERIIDFCEPKAKTQAVNLFSQHITPLLMDAATAPTERKFLFNLARRLQKSNTFVSIVPKWGKTSKPGGRSFASRALDGMPAFLHPSFLEIPYEERATAEVPNTLAQYKTSYITELLLDKVGAELLEDISGQWHLKPSALRSSLLHELTHILDLVKSFPDPSGCLSTRWTNPVEERTVKRENLFLNERGEAQRVCHLVLTLYEPHINQSRTLRLFDALMFGADGTAGELVYQGLQYPEGDPERIELDKNSLEKYAKGYLNMFLNIKSEDIDLPFCNEIIGHKNNALEIFIRSLCNRPEGTKLGKQLMEIILKQAGTPIPFVNQLREIYFAD